MKKKIKRNYLDLRPSLTDKVSWRMERDEEKAWVVLEIPHRGIFDRLAQRLLHKPPITYVHLDEIGSFLWPLIDGERTVSDLALLLKEKMGEKAEPLYPRIVTYFRNVESYGFVKLN